MPFRDEDLPFDGLTNRFIVYYVQHQDIPKASAIVGIKTERGNEIYQRTEVRTEIDRRLNMFHMELAKLEAQAMFLNESKLDSTLLGIIESRETSQQTKVRAVEVGYKKIGKLRDKVEHSGEDGGPMVFTLKRIEGSEE